MANTASVLLHFRFKDIPDGDLRFINQTMAKRMVAVMIELNANIASESHIVPFCSKGLLYEKC